MFGFELVAVCLYFFFASQNCGRDNDCRRGLEFNRSFTCKSSQKNKRDLFDACQPTAVNHLGGSTHSMTSQATLVEGNQE